jgi:predicted nucleic acid-binding protein
MDSIFVDTDICYDLLLERQPFYHYAARLFTLSDNAKIRLYVSSLCFSNLHYLLSKQYNRQESLRILSQFKVLVNVLAVDEKIIDLALNSTFPDFEDAIQYYTAIENNIPLIITRNLKDYKRASIAVMTAEAYIKNR